MKCMICMIKLEEDIKEVAVKGQRNITQTVKTGYLCCVNCGALYKKLRQCSTCEHYVLAHRDDYYCGFKNEEVAEYGVCNEYEEAT